MAMFNLNLNRIERSDTSLKSARDYFKILDEGTESTEQLIGAAGGDDSGNSVGSAADLSSPHSTQSSASEIDSFRSDFDPDDMIDVLRSFIDDLPEEGSDCVSESGDERLLVLRKALGRMGKSERSLNKLARVRSNPLAHSGGVSPRTAKSPNKLAASSDGAGKLMKRSTSFHGSPRLSHSAGPSPRPSPRPSLERVNSSHQWEGGSGRSSSASSREQSPRVMTLFDRMISEEEVQQRKASSTGTSPKSARRVEQDSEVTVAEELLLAAAKKVDAIKAEKRVNKARSKEKQRPDISAYSVDVLCDSQKQLIECYDTLAMHKNVRVRMFPPSLKDQRCVVVLPCTSSLSGIKAHCIDLIEKRAGPEFMPFLRQTVLEVCLGEMVPGTCMLFRATPKMYVALVCVASSVSATNALPIYHAMRSALLCVKNYNASLGADSFAVPLWVMEAVRFKSHPTLRRVYILPPPGLSCSRPAIARAMGAAYGATLRAGEKEMHNINMLEMLEGTLNSEESGESQEECDRRRLCLLMTRDQLPSRGLATVSEAMALFRMFLSDDEHTRLTALDNFQRILGSFGKTQRDLPFALKRPQLCSCLAMNPAAFQALLAGAQARKVVVHQEINEEEVVVKELLGQGGTAKVFRAEWKGFECAFKKYFVGSDPTEFLREASIMSVISHPNLIRVLGTSSPDQEEPFLLIELAELSLFELLYERPETQIQPSRALVIAIQACRGLQHIHSLGLVHRDIKSGNVLLTEGTIVKLSDYGTARIIGDHSTMTGNVGTTYWMAPEVFQEEGYGEKADVYSFGMLLFEIFARQVPFKDTPTFRIPLMVVKGKRPAIPDRVPRSVAKVMELCWHQKPAKRPSAERVLQMLDALKVEFQ